MPFRNASTTSPSNSIFSSLPATVVTPFGFGAGRPLGTGLRDSSGCLRGYDDVGRLGALLALTRLELDFRVLGQGLEPLARDVRVVHEEILPAVLRRDESVSLRVVKPLHGSGCHQISTSLTTHERTRRRRATGTRSGSHVKSSRFGRKAGIRLPNKGAAELAGYWTATSSISM